jgi:hypothetical protein
MAARDAREQELELPQRLAARMLLFTRGGGGDARDPRSRSCASLRVVRFAGTCAVRGPEPTGAAGHGNKRKGPQPALANPR